MYFAIQILASSSSGGNEKMPKSKTALMGLVVICITILCGLLIVRDSLCEVRYKGGGTDFLARFVVYETRMK